MSEDRNIDYGHDQCIASSHCRRCTCPDECCDEKRKLSHIACTDEYCYGDDDNCV